MKYVRKRMELPAGRGVWAPQRPRTPRGGCCPSSAYCRSAAWSPRCPASTRVCSRGPRSILLVYLIYTARHVSDVWRGMDSLYSHSSLYLMLLLWYDKCPCLRPVPAASSVHSRRVASVHRVSILTGHWTLDTDIGRHDDDDDDDGTRFQLFFSYYLSLTVRAATATSQYRYLLLAAQHRTPSIVNTNTEMKTQHNPFVILSIINLHLIISFKWYAPWKIII